MNSAVHAIFPVIRSLNLNILIVFILKESLISSFDHGFKYKSSKFHSVIGLTIAVSPNHSIR